MATAIGKRECVTCKKEKSTYICDGCSNNFCFDHLNQHRQQLGEQLDDIENRRNIFRQTLTEQRTSPEKNVLIQQINQWERDSIKKIKETAEESRAILLTHTYEYINELEVRLNQLTKQLKEARQENDYNEIVLNQLKKSLDRLEEELIRPSNILLRKDSSTFIRKISVLITSASFRIPDIPINAKWKQNGVTVAGGNGEGSAQHQLNLPSSIYVDDDQTIFVTDMYNHRIVKWKKNAMNGEVVAGGNGKGNRNDQLNSPVNFIVDKTNNCLIIADWGNQRIVRWSCEGRTYGETIVSNIDCWGLAIDNNGYFYVSNIGKHEVRRYKMGETNGVLVAGGNGQGNRLNQLNKPYHIFVDQNDSVFISDNGNNRVVKWLKDAKEGIVVVGGYGQGDQLTPLLDPSGVIVDQLETIYIVEFDNNRVMCWMEGKKQGTVIVGGNGSGIQANQLTGPATIAFDRENNLYVVDSRNHRVQEFSIESSN